MLYSQSKAGRLRGCACLTYALSGLWISKVLLAAIFWNSQFEISLKFRKWRLEKNRVTQY